MTAEFSRLFARMAVAGVLAFALGLAACGRKSGLDPPPSAAVDPPPATQSGANELPPGAAQNGFGPDGRPVAAAGAKKRLPIDFLLD